MEKAKKVLFDLFSEYEIYEDIISSLRSLNTEKVITNKEYDYLCKNYDELLENWLNNYKER